MDVSDREVIEPTGTQLLDAVVSLTGLPENQIQSELGAILSTAGADPASLTLDELRAAMVAYLEFVQQDMLAAEAQESAELHQNN